MRTTRNPSDEHPNRQAHNWLVYRDIDKSLVSAQELIGGVLIDLGCGVMPYRTWLNERCDNYIGIDWSSTLHELKADIVADLNQALPVEKCVADTVLSMDVMEHLREPSQFLREANRILRSGGTLILRVPWQWWVHEVPFDYFRYTPYGLRYLLETAGFDNISVQPQGGFFTMIILKLNYFSLRLIRGPRLLRFFVRASLSLGWFLGQKAAPILDRLDRDFALETCGYFITARKP